MNPADYLRKIEQQYNLPDGYLARTRQIESRNGQNTYNPKSGAAGDFQFIPSTAKAYGLADPYDFYQAADAAGRFSRDNANILRNKLGRDPTAGELYLAHQQGAGGATKLLANPDAPAGQIVGTKAVAWNGGDPNAPASAFAAKWMGKFDGTQSQAGGNTQVADASEASAAPSAPSGWNGYQAPTQDDLRSLLDSFDAPEQQKPQEPSMAAPTLAANAPNPGTANMLAEMLMRRRPRGLI